MESGSHDELRLDSLLILRELLSLGGSSSLELCLELLRLDSLLELGGLLSLSGSSSLKLCMELFRLWSRHGSLVRGSRAK